MILLLYPKKNPVSNDSYDITKPRLLINKNDKPFIVSYLLSSIHWNCNCTGLLDKNKNLFIFTIIR